MIPLILGNPHIAEAGSRCSGTAPSGRALGQGSLLAGAEGV